MTFHPNASIQLPDDVISTGYKEVRPFHHAQVFFSPLLNFTGTEEEFVKACHAYRFVQIDKHTRRELPN